MYLLITLLLSGWTFYLATQVSSGLWDSIILLLWIAWPLYLTSILIYAKDGVRGSGIWKFRNLGDFLLAGALVPLVLGIVFFNITMMLNAQNPDVSFSENLFFVGVFSVAHWGVTGLSILAFYMASKFYLKKKTQAG